MPATTDNNEPWRQVHRTLRRHWLGYLSITAIGTTLFLASFFSRTGSDLSPLLALISILGLRRMWTIDRRIIALRRDIAARTK